MRSYPSAGTIQLKDYYKNMDKSRYSDPSISTGVSGIDHRGWAKLNCTDFYIMGENTVM